MANENFKSQVIAAAQKLFQERGLGMVTMEDVASAVGKGKSTLYYYFKSKEEIFNAVFDSEMGEVVIETLKRISAKNTFQEKLQAFAHTKLEMVLKRKSLYKAMEVGMDAEAFSKYMDAKKAIHQTYLQKEMLTLQQVFFNAIQMQEIPEMSTSDMEEYIFVFLSAIRGINREYVVHGNSDDGRTALDVFCKIFCKGIQ